MVGIPVRGRRSALLVVGEPRHGAFDEGALERLSLVAELASTALDNARLVDSFARLERLLRGAVDASAAIVESTEPAVVRRRLLGALVDRVGMSGAALWQEREDGAGMTLVASAGLPHDVRERVAILPVTSMAARMASGQLGARLRHTVTSAATSSWDGHVVRLVPVPEPARGVLGVYADRALPELVDDVLATLAHALASAVHQTTLHQRARTVVDSLQRELRPRTVVLPAGLSVGTVYRSATAGVEVGGDFYDVFATRSGQIGIACGDVSGKGVEAASLTAMAVYSLRAFALPGISPPGVLAMLNGAVVEQTSAEHFMTLAYLRLDVETWTLQLAVAGHPPPVLVDHRGPRLLDVVPGVPIGVLADEAYTPVDLYLDEGAALVLYTDGVSEARCGGAPGGELLGAEGLLRAVAALPAVAAQRLADGVWAAVLDWTGGGTSDDCAVVVVRRAGPAEARLDVALARTA